MAKLPWKKNNFYSICVFTTLLASAFQRNHTEKIRKAGWGNGKHCKQKITNSSFLSPPAINIILIKIKVMQSACTPYKIIALILAFVTEKLTFSHCHNRKLILNHSPHVKRYSHSDITSFLIKNNNLRVWVSTYKVITWFS